MPVQVDRRASNVRKSQYFAMIVNKFQSICADIYPSSISNSNMDGEAMRMDEDGILQKNDN